MKGKNCMGLTEIIILSIGLSMDAFAVAMCKGLSMRKMSWKKAIVIALYFGIFQAVMPIRESKKVIIPIQVTENTILHFKNANVIPIAKASILVAIANTIILLKSILSLLSLSASLQIFFNILIPIIVNKIKAIQ
jgi:hypothetical protein